MSVSLIFNQIEINAAMILFLFKEVKGGRQSNALSAYFILHFYLTFRKYMHFLTFLCVCMPLVDKSLLEKFLFKRFFEFCNDTP